MLSSLRHSVHYALDLGLSKRSIEKHYRIEVGVRVRIYGAPVAEAEIAVGTRHRPWLVQRSRAARCTVHVNCSHVGASTLDHTVMNPHAQRRVDGWYEIRLHTVAEHVHVEAAIAATLQIEYDIVHCARCRATIDQAWIINSIGELFHPCGYAEGAIKVNTRGKCEILRVEVDSRVGIARMISYVRHGRAGRQANTRYLIDIIGVEFPIIGDGRRIGVRLCGRRCTRNGTCWRLGRCLGGRAGWCSCCGSAEKAVLVYLIADFPHAAFRIGLQITSILKQINN